MPLRALRQYFMVKSESKNMQTRHKSKNKKVFNRDKGKHTDSVMLQSWTFPRQKKKKLSNLAETEIYFSLKICCGSRGPSGASLRHWMRIQRDRRSTLLELYRLEHVISWFGDTKRIRENSTLTFMCLHPTHFCTYVIGQSKFHGCVLEIREI